MTPRNNSYTSQSRYAFRTSFSQYWATSTIRPNLTIASISLPSIPMAFQASRPLPRGPRRRFGVDRLAPAFWVSAPVRDQPPLQKVQRPLSGLMVLPNDQQLLAGRGVVPPRCVRQAAVPDVETIDDGEAKGP